MINGPASYTARMFESIIISGAVGLGIGTWLYLKQPSWVQKKRRPARNPAEEVAARLRAVVPDELIESIEVDMENRAQPIALELAREPTPDEQTKINTACNRAIRDLVEIERTGQVAEDAEPEAAAN